jgi:capsular polysaccharide transport system permease protein
LIEPIAHIAFPVIVFGFIVDRHVTGYDYLVFLLYGLLPYFLFRTICTQTMEGVNAGRGLLSYRPVHLIDLLMTKALFTMALELGLFLIIGALLSALGYYLVPARPFEWLFLLVGASLFGFGLGMIFAAIMSVMPDARSVIRIMFMPLYLMSGVVLPISRFPAEAVEWLSYNPVLHWVEASRQLGLEHYRPIDQLSYRMIFFSMAVTVFFGLSLYRLRRLSRVTT